MTDNPNGELQVHANTDASATCNFCIRRTPATLRLSSTHPGRRLVVYLCQSCGLALLRDLGRD